MSKKKADDKEVVVQQDLETLIERVKAGLEPLPWEKPIEQVKQQNNDRPEAE